MQILLALEKLYMNFFMRDLAYLFGGAVVLLSFLSPPEGCLKNLVMRQPWQIVVIFLASAYIIGLLASEMVFLIHRKFARRKNGKTPPELDHAEHASLMYKIERIDPSGNTLLRIERLTYLKSAVSCFLGSFPLVIIIICIRTWLVRNLAISNSYWYIASFIIALLVASVIAFVDYRRITEDEYQTKTALSKKRPRKANLERLNEIV